AGDAALVVLGATGTEARQLACRKSGPRRVSRGGGGPGPADDVAVPAAADACRTARTLTALWRRYVRPGGLEFLPQRSRRALLRSRYRDLAPPPDGRPRRVRLDGRDHLPAARLYGAALSDGCPHRHGGGHRDHVGLPERAVAGQSPSPRR